MSLGQDIVTTFSLTTAAEFPLPAPGELPDCGVEHPTAAVVKANNKDVLNSQRFLFDANISY